MSEIEEFGGGFEEDPVIMPATSTDSNTGPYKLCNLKDAEAKMNEKIDNIKAILALPDDSIILLLQHFKWNDESLIQSWVDESCIKKISEKAGLVLIPKYQTAKECPICGNQIDKCVSLPCGHTACQFCLTQMIEIGLKYNEASYSCWECKNKIPISIIKSCLSKNEFDKVRKCLIRSYTNENKMIRWCPNKGCDYYCEFPDMLAQDIACNCGYIYCFKCGKESHRPAKCTSKEEWDKQNLENDECLLELIAKKCPKCKVYIDKNGGCFQMTCFKCKHQFCWMCLEDWKTHTDHFACLKFPGVLVESVNDQQKKNVEEKIKSFFYERNIDQQRSKIAAEKLLVEIKLFITHFCECCKFHRSELEFLIDACSTVIRSRRILANTYVDMFYCKDEKEKKIVEILMERLQFSCDAIHNLIQLNKEEFYGDSEQHKLFFNYKQEIMSKASVLKIALKNFEDGYEAGYTQSK